MPGPNGRTGDVWIKTVKASAVTVLEGKWDESWQLTPSPYKLQWKHGLCLASRSSLSC